MKFKRMLYYVAVILAVEIALAMPALAVEFPKELDNAAIATAQNHITQDCERMKSKMLSQINEYMSYNNASFGVHAKDHPNQEPHLGSVQTMYTQCVPPGNDIKIPDETIKKEARMALGGYIELNGKELFSSESLNNFDDRAIALVKDELNSTFTPRKKSKDRSAKWEDYDWSDYRSWQGYSSKDGSGGESSGWRAERERRKRSIKEYIDKNMRCEDLNIVGYDVKNYEETYYTGLELYTTIHLCPSDNSDEGPVIPDEGPFESGVRGGKGVGYFTLTGGSITYLKDKQFKYPLVSDKKQAIIDFFLEESGSGYSQEIRMKKGNPTIDPAPDHFPFITYQEPELKPCCSTSPGIGTAQESREEDIPPTDANQSDEDKKKDKPRIGPSGSGSNSQRPDSNR